MDTKPHRPVKAEAPAPAPLPTPETLRNLLAGVPLFHELDPATLDGLAAGCQWLDVEPGAAVIEEGRQGDALYAVLKGRLLALQHVDGSEVLLHELTKGESFGEVALLEDAPRSATVKAVEPSRLLTLSRGAFESALEKKPAIRARMVELAAQRRAWSSKLRARPAPAELRQRLATLTQVTDADTLRDLESELGWITVPAKSHLMRQGEPGDALYFLLGGELEVTTQREDGSRVRVGRLEPGSTVGEMALLTDAPRSADVIATSDAELLRLSRAGYEALVRMHPQTMLVFSQSLAQRLVTQLQARAVQAQVGAMPMPTHAECLDVVHTPDLVLRNLRITQMYYRLSLQMAGLLGQQDANWCTFATHASKTAGYSIRKQELPGYETVLWLEDNFEPFAGVEKLADQVLGKLGRVGGLTRRLTGITEHISDCISAGNLKVFAELAPVFAAFLRAFQSATRPDPVALEELLSTLEPGASDIGGQDLLAEALRNYHLALFEPDQKRKAELILLANCRIGLHEQTRLQPYIVEALDTPIGDALEPLLPAFGLLARLGRDGRSAHAQLERTLARRWRIFATRTMMRLRLPYGDLSLGRDIPRLPNRQIFPDVLDTIALPELKQLMSRFDRTRDGLRNSRAADWGDLDERMNTIVNLFRSRQRSYELFSQPFQYEQRAQMGEGRVPEGRL